jgi:hypothetical protein
VSDCVLWKGGRYVSGYGQRYREGRGQLAHRVAWEEVNGPIPEEMHVHHRCRNRLCVNVEHMELLSNADHHGKLSGHGKLTREDAAEIREMVAAGVPFRSIAAMYDVSRSNISQIVRGRRWGLEPLPPIKRTCRYCGLRIRPAAHANHERAHETGGRVKRGERRVAA